MLRAGLFALLVGPATAGLTGECMKGLQQLEGANDVELSLRCRSAFGPEACKQARQSLGTQPWTHARMEGSCKQFAATYEGMDARTLEAAVATKTSTDGAVNAKVSQQPLPAAPMPVQQPEEHEGPIAGLLAKLKEKKQEAEAKAELAKGESEEKQDGPLAGLINKMKEAKATHEAQATQDVAAEGDNEAEGPLGGLIKKMKEAKEERKNNAAEVESDQEEPLADMFKQGEKPLKGDNKAEGPLAGLIKKMKEAKQKREKNAAEVESDQEEPLADMFKQGEKPLKLYRDAQIEPPAMASDRRQVLGAFVGAASLAAVTLFVASRRAAPMSHEQLSEQLDVEQSME